MTNRILTDTEMDRLELRFGANPPAEKAPEMTGAQKLASAFVLGLSLAAMFIL